MLCYGTVVHKICAPVCTGTGTRMMYVPVVHECGVWYIHVHVYVVLVDVYTSDLHVFAHLCLTNFKQHAKLTLNSFASAMPGG